MARNGDVAVFLVDAGSTMTAETKLEDDDVKSHFEKSLSLVRSILVHKILLNPHDCATVVLYGTEDTQNILNQGSGGYKHVKMLGEMSAPTADYCRSLKPSLKPEKSYKVDLTSAVAVAADLLDRGVRELKKNGGRQIFIFTDGKNGIGSNATRTAGELKANDQTPVLIWTGGETSDKEHFQQFIAEADGLFLENKDAIESLRAFRVFKAKQISKTRVPLMINTLEIPVWVFLKVRAATVPTLKTEVTETQASIKLDRCFLRVNPEEAITETVEEKDRCKAYLYGADLVPTADFEAVALKYSGGPKSIKILCSMATSKVQPEMFLGSTECVMADPNNKAGKLAVMDLVNALLTEEMCLIVRYVWREPYDPKLMLMWAHEKRRCLYMNQMPYAEDCRPLSLPSLKPASQEKKDAMQRFVEEMTLQPGQYKASNMLNPRIQKFYKHCESKLLDEPVSGVENLDNVMAPDPVLMKSTKESGVVGILQSLFPLNKVRQTTGKRGRGLAEKLAEKEQILKRGAADVDALLGDDADAQAAKKARVAQLSVGTTDPSEDFREMLKVTEADLTERAVEEMGKAIRTLIFEGGISYFVKAVRAIETFKSLAASEKYTKQFIKFMRELKPECQVSAPLAWERIKSQKLGLINKIEDSEEGVSLDECNEFFGDVKVLPVPTKMEDVREDDDLLDLLE